MIFKDLDEDEQETAIGYVASYRKTVDEFARNAWETLLNCLQAELGCDRLSAIDIASQIRMEHSADGD